MFVLPSVGLPGGLITVLFIGLEIAAMVFGVLGRTTLQGKASLVIASLLLMFALTELFCAYRAVRRAA